MIETNIVERMKIVTLTAKEAMRVIRDCNQLGVRGGGIYDCLHIAAARKVGAQQVLTLNMRHFATFAPTWLQESASRDPLTIRRALRGISARYEGQRLN